MKKLIYLYPLLKLGIILSLFLVFSSQAQQKSQPTQQKPVTQQKAPPTKASSRSAQQPTQQTQQKSQTPAQQKAVTQQKAPPTKASARSCPAGHSTGPTKTSAPRSTEKSKYTIRSVIKAITPGPAGHSTDPTKTSDPRSTEGGSFQEGLCSFRPAGHSTGPTKTSAHSTGATTSCSFQAWFQYGETGSVHRSLSWSGGARGQFDLGSIWGHVVFIMNHPEFLKYIQKMVSNPNTQMFWVLEGLALVLLLLLRGWKFSRKQSYGTYLWAELWTGFLGFFVMFFLIPAILFQKDFISSLIVASILWSSH